MKKVRSIFTLVFLLLAQASFAQNQNEFDQDRTLSPYFFIPSEDSETDQLPLKTTQAEVNIAGVIADVHVSQVYENLGKKTLEAIYVFPASTRAAVYRMQMKIGERTIEARIRKRADARREYEEARAAGKSASLLEQQRPNVFQMNVANILPGDIVQVDLYYTELLTPVDRTYEFVYPTVVGPRYSNQMQSEAPASEKWIANPYLEEGTKTPYTFHIEAKLNTGVPIQQITSTSHKVNIAYNAPDEASIVLNPAEKDGGNRDFILKYQLAGDKIESGLLLYGGEEENFFLAMIQPPQRILPDQIPNREYIFIIDVSGSMNGFPIEISKILMKDLINNLRPADHFNVILFAGGSKILANKSLPATQENIKRATNMIDNEHGAGGTELLPALKRALALPRLEEEYARTVIIASDGYVQVERAAFDLIRNNLGEANVFSFGIGSSVNRYLIEGIARTGLGESFIVTKPDEAQRQALKFRKYIQSPVLTNIKLQTSRFDAYEIEPITIPDLFAERPILIFGKYHGKPEGSILLTGSGGFTKRLNLEEFKPVSKNSALRYLWARHKIAILSDYNRAETSAEERLKITELGLKYNLLTEYTSFVAIDSKQRNESGQITRVEQPLPLPQGVPMSAVGSMGSVASLKRGSTIKSADISSAMEIVGTEEEKDAKQNIITISEIKVNQIVYQSTVTRYISSKLPNLERCVRSRAGKFSSGLVTLKITLDTQGNVLKIENVADKLNDKSLTDCLIKQIKNWVIANQAGKTKLEILLTLQVTSIK